MFGVTYLYHAQTRARSDSTAAFTYDCISSHKYVKNALSRIHAQLLCSSDYSFTMNLFAIPHATK